MRKWGVPAPKRAVPLCLLGRVRRSRDPSTSAGTAGDVTLRELIEQLPADLREKALTHASWVRERTRSYERLEFLGDSVLGLAIAAELYSRYPTCEEGDLARMKAFIVSRASCAQVARQLDVARLILDYAPVSEPRRREIIRNDTILGNVLEALIGAVYLERGFDQTKPALVKAFGEQIRYALERYVDHKTVLQELLAAQGLQPEYRLVIETGPPHARVFTSEVQVQGIVRGRGTGTTIKMSEQAAAQEALEALGAGAAGSDADEASVDTTGPGG